MKSLNTLSTDEVVEIAERALPNIPIARMQQICNLIEENVLDGAVLAAVDIKDLLIIMADIPSGYVVKIFKSLQEYNKQLPNASPNSASEQTRFEMDTGSGDGHLSNSDTIPIEEEPATCSTKLIDFEESAVISCSDSDCTDQSEGNSSVPNLVSTKPVPKEFPIALCNFGYYAKEVIKLGRLTELGKREITSSVINVMQKFESHPSRSLRKAAVAALVQQGKLNLGLSEEEAKQFWLRKISMKINSQAKQRRRLISSERAPNSTRALNNLSGVADATVVKRRKIVNTSFIINSERAAKEEEIKQKQQIIKMELSKPAPLRNKRRIDELMQDTFSFRQRFIASHSPSPVVMFQEWPALFHYFQLMKEFRRLSTLPSDNDLTESARKLFLQIVDFARQKTKKSTGLLNVLRKLPLDDEDESLTLNEVVAFGIWCLCHLLKSNSKKSTSAERYFLDVYPANTAAEDITSVTDRLQPFIVVYGDVGDPRKIAVFAEHKVLLEVSTVVEGVAALFAIYYCLNYAYSPHVGKALQYIQRYWLSIRKPDIQDAVKELALYML